MKAPTTKEELVKVANEIKEAFIARDEFRFVQVHTCSMLVWIENASIFIRLATIPQEAFTNGYFENAPTECKTSFGISFEAGKAKPKFKSYQGKAIRARAVRDLDHLVGFVTSEFVWIAK